VSAAHGSPPAAPRALACEDLREVVDGSRTSLLDAVDRLVEKGAVLQGQAVISIAQVDLIRLDLDLLLAAVETLDQREARRGVRLRPRVAATPALTPPRAEARDVSVSPRLRGEEPRRHADTATPAARAPAAPPPPERVALDRKSADKGVARLVLTLVDFIRQLLERQAIRRMEGGLLSEEAVDEMGDTLARLEEKMLEMKRAFGLEGEALDLDLGPLGRLTGTDERT
jgi:hypothetical protein